jgi:hypothetical protein
LIFSQVVLGTAEFAYNTEIELDPAVWKRSQQQIRPIFDAFLVAHEYGHIMLGHYKGRPVAGRAASYERELAADAYAFRLMLAAFKGEPMHVYVRASSLLLGMTLIERGYGLFRQEEYEGYSVP